MENGPEVPQTTGFWQSLIRAWFGFSGRRIRLLQASDVSTEGPALFAVSHPAGWVHALALATTLPRTVHCLLPQDLVRGPFARFLAHHLGFILYPADSPRSEATLREAIDVLAVGGALAVFADQVAAGQTGPGAIASTAASLVSRAEAQHVGRRVAVFPVHLFLPESDAHTREILIYVDAAMRRADVQDFPPSHVATAPTFVTALESRFEENAFQLRSSDLQYFLADLEEVLRTDLHEDWAGRADWKQDADGFVLSRLVEDWAHQTNFLHPSQLVRLRESLDEYRRLKRQCALRELEIEGADSPLQSGWRGAAVWIEMVLGLPIALYGLLNHLLIALVLTLAGSFKKNSTRARSTEWTLRAMVILIFYSVQIYLVAHWRGRAAAGYYAPTLPVAGAYLWRYLRLVRPQARVLLISLTIPALSRKIKRLRCHLLREIDQTLATSEDGTAVTR